MGNALFETALQCVPRYTATRLVDYVSETYRCLKFGDVCENERNITQITYIYLLIYIFSVSQQRSDSLI